MKKKAINTSELTVKTLRQSMGYSQQDLAERLGLHWRTVADWELKGVVPSFETVVQMSKVMQVSLKTLAKAFSIDTTGIPDDSPTE